jgi:hypothetical protein
LAITPLRALAPLLFLTGCAGLPQDRVSFGQLSDCPKLTARLLAESQGQLGPLTDTHTLACALTFLRANQDPELRRTPLGSRLCLNLAERETDQGKREMLAAEGVSFAESAIALGSGSDGAVHYYLATNLGLAVRENIPLAMENLARLESELKQAVVLASGLDDGGPLRVLGALYLKAPAWPAGIGDRDKALELLEQAVHKHPGHPLNHLFYAQALWDDYSETNAAKAKTEFAAGWKLLEEGHWGYRQAPWQKEFEAFKQEMASDSSGRVAFS